MHDIGEIRLSPSVMLAAGVVCEPDAPQLEDGAWVELHPSDQEGDLGSSARIFEDRPIGMCGGLGDRDLLRAGRYHVSVGEHGNFAIRGAPLASPFTLRVKGKPYAASDVKHIMSGTRGLELTVSKWGHVAGWITTSPDVKPEELLVEILGPTVDHKTTAIVYCDGEFSARKIPAGLVRVLVREQGANQPLALVENVRVMSGEATEDPRLDPIDVRGKIRQMSLRVVDPTGRPIPRADVYPQAHALIPGYDLRKTDANGEVSFPVAAAPLRCVVRAAGFRLRCIELSKSATLTIHPGIPVRLYLDFGVPIPAGVTGTVYLGSKDYGWSYARSDRPPAVKKEIKLATPYVDLTVEAPGRHDIRVRIDSGTVADLGSHAITIQDKNERQEFRIRFDPKKVRAELEDE